MKLIEGLEILRKAPPQDWPSLKVSLACGFSPLHLETFIGAHLQLLFPGKHVEVQTGLYGDLAETLEHLDGSSVDASAIVLEWPDLDPRLGIRRLGGWGPGDLPDVVQNVRAQSLRIQRIVERLSPQMTLAICLPTLPVPPVSFMPGWSASHFDVDLEESVSSLRIKISKTSARVVNPQRIGWLSPMRDRLDVKSELLFGFPYKVPHAEVLAELLACLIRNPVPKKGLITDLDDTLWAGIVGEVGVEGISWDLDHHSQMHGLYQQLLRALADQGVLIAVASKNEAGLVDEAFRKMGTILPANRIFPLEVHWGAKSESVSRILKTWNVGPESVVFVDDSPMDLGEVKVAHPEIDCLLFPKNDYQAAYELLVRLRDLFGKDGVSDEDAIRLECIRRAHTSAKGSEELSRSPDHFLREADPRLTLSFFKTPPDFRALELVNKTNQFNLNGKRQTEASWRRYLSDPDAFLCVAAYEDEFGPLGKIAVLGGRLRESTLFIDVWVMSCRAFSRRIEHCCLDHLLRKFAVEDIVFDFLATPRNRPIQNFLAEFCDGPPQPGLRLPRNRFFENCPPLFHAVREFANG
jgi:FkbH-like protein